MSAQREGFYEFEPFRVDAAKRRLLRDGIAQPLKPKVFDTLLVLVENSGRVVEKDELMRRVWPDTIVEENNLTQNISAIRKALGERRDEHRYVVTIPGRGYRFVADVRKTGGEEGQGDALARAPGETKDEENGAGDNGSAVRIEEAEEGRVRLPNVADVPAPRGKSFRRAVAAALVLSALLIGLVVALPRLRRSVASQPAPAESARAVESIAVLPFVPLGAEAGDEHTGPGMADALITRLSNSRRLTVRSTSAVLRYAGQDPVAAGRELNVDAVLDGKFQRDGERVRVTVQLVRVRDGAALWAATFDEPFTDIFAMQDSISEQVAGALTLRLTREDRERMLKRYTESAEAYQAYLKGRFLLDRRTAASVQRAKDYFEEAVERDPRYALAYVGLADCYHRFAQFRMAPTSEAIPKATEAAATALRLDETLAEAHATLGVINFRYAWDSPAAEREFKRALELDPRYATAHMWYGLHLMAAGKSEEAEREMRRALELEPLSITVNNAMGDYYLQKREYDRALEHYRKTIEMDPSMLAAQVGIGRAYEQKGMYAEALRQYELVREKSESKRLPGAAGYTYAVTGRRDEARKMLKRLTAPAQELSENPYLAAVIYAGLGERDAAFEWLEKSLAERALMPGPLLFDPRLDTLRGDARFKHLARRMNLNL
ncbi:MAG TPA: tetratricopeptide repeat protein [Pyrinomonadaceae bacterium]|nr:tetratricopeptide repeat protein [Pyrinomonadaceae bacterium]